MHESDRKTVSFFEKIRYVAQMYTEMELNEDSVYRNGHSLNSIDSSNSNHISSFPYLKPTTVVDDVVVDTREAEKTKKEEVKQHRHQQHLPCGMIIRFIYMTWPLSILNLKNL